MVKMFRLLRKLSLMVEVSNLSIKSEPAIHVCTMLQESRSENITEKNLCMRLFSNKVADLEPGTSFEKCLCTRVFHEVLPNILERLSCKTRPGVSFCKISFCLSRQPQSKNVTIDLVFSLLL